MTTADDRAECARLWEEAGQAHIEKVDGLAPTGWQAWCAAGSVALLPALAPGAPLEFRRRYLARARAATTGLCPLCGQAAGLPTPTDRGAAHRAKVSPSVGCPALFAEADKRWIDPRALGA